MLIEVNREQFQQILLDKGTALQSRKLYAAPLNASICSRWISEIPPELMTLLLWMAGRTVCMGYGVAKVPIRDIQNGYDNGDAGRVAPLKLATNTLRKRLNDLVDVGILHAYRVHVDGNAIDKLGVIYEIDFTFALNYDPQRCLGGHMVAQIEALVMQEKSGIDISKLLNDAVYMSNLHAFTYQNPQVYISKSTESSEKVQTSATYTPSPRKFTCQNSQVYISKSTESSEKAPIYMSNSDMSRAGARTRGNTYKYINTLIPINKCINNEVPTDVAACFAAPSFIGGNQLQTEVEGRTILKSISIPKKRRVTAVRSESVETVIATTQTRRVAVAATRIAQASSGKITIDSLQALLDRSMKEFYPGLPRLIVTAKPFGVLRKRLESGTVHDIPNFIYFSIREWNLIAGRNRAAFLKNPGRAAGGSPLAPSPTFNELAYRLPYFLSIYSQTLTNVNPATAKDSQGDDQVARLQTRLDNAERENQSNRAVIRRIRRSPATEVPTVNARGTLAGPVFSPVRPRPKASPATRSTDRDIDEDWSPPEWTSPPSDKK